MALIRKSTDFNWVLRELEQRGMRFDPTKEMPNKTIVCEDTRELFYLQSEPQLAGYAQYSTMDDLKQALHNITVARKPKNMKITIVEPMVADWRNN